MDTTDTYTEPEIRAMAEAYSTIRELAERYFWSRYDADPEWQRRFIERPDIEAIRFEGDTIAFDCECRACRRGCCGTDYHTYEFPLSYLWQDQAEVLADIKAKAEEQTRQEAAEKARRETDEAKRREQREKAMLTELKAKWEPAS